jgi:hypothetical protein
MKRSGFAQLLIGIWVTTMCLQNLQGAGQNSLFDLLTQTRAVNIETIVDAQCDENKSGAGFKFSAGRTRRNSGIESAIERSESEIYPVDHSAYFP